MMTLRIVFFDIDGTLLATGGAGQTAMERALVEEFRLELPFEGVRTGGRTDSGIMTEIFDRHGIPHSDEQRQRFRTAYLDRLPECLDALPGTLLPGVSDLLDRLSQSDNVVLSLLTGNYTESAWAKLRHFGLDERFEFGGFGDFHIDRNLVAGDAKAAAESALGLSIAGDQCCVVGDTPADIECARSIGADSVAVATGVYNHQELQAHTPDYLFATFSDVSAAARAIVPV